MTIRRHVMLSLIGLIVLTTVGASLFNYYTVRQSLAASTLSHLASVASVQKYRLEAALAQRRERLALIASRTQMRLSLERFITTGELAAQERMNRIVTDAVSTIADFKHICLLDLSGKVLASTEAERIGQDMSALPAFQAGLAEIRVDILGLGADGNPTSWLVGPLLLGKKPLGVIMIESSVGDLLNEVSDYTGLGATGETVLARRDAQGDAEFLTALRFDAAASLQRRVSRSRLDVPIIQALLTNETTMESATSYRGETVLAVTRYLPGPDWGLVVIQDHAEAFAPLYRLEIYSALIGIFAIFLASLASAYIARGVTQPLNDLVNQATMYQQGQGDFQQSGSAGNNRYIEIQLLRETLQRLAHELTDRNESLARSLKQTESESESRAQALEELKRMQAMLMQSERLAALGDTVAGMVHEVNTPLGLSVTMASTIGCAVEQASAKLANESLTQTDLEDMMDVCGEGCEIMIRNLQRAADMMRSYQVVSVDQASNADRDFNLRSYIDDVLVHLRPKTKGRPQQIEVSGPDDLMLHGVPGAISQILSNLIMNSYLHGFAEQDDGHIWISIADEGNQAKLVYRDDGCGMSNDVREHVFDKFFTTRRGTGGHGLGMNLVKHLVEDQLQGRIEIQSAPGEGTTFTLHFPKKSKAAG